MEVVNMTDSQFCANCFMYNLVNPPKDPVKQNYSHFIDAETEAQGG